MVLQSFQKMYRVVLKVLKGKPHGTESVEIFWFSIEKVLKKYEKCFLKMWWEPWMNEWIIIITMHVKMHITTTTKILQCTANGSDFRVK